MIALLEAKQRVERLFLMHPAVMIEDPQQCGKTTLARRTGGEDVTYFDLERPVDLKKLAAPELTLADQLKKTG